jgi:hypothetical protein
MRPTRAWAALSLIFFLAVIVISAALVDMGYGSMPIALSAMVTVMAYLYVLYKRYHVEVVPESDVRLFDDIDDLRILSRIYGTDDSGDAEALRQRLIKFVRANENRAFTWVAPRSVLTFGSAFELAPSPPAREPAKRVSWLAGQLAEPTASHRQRVLLGEKPRSNARLSSIKTCPMCDAQAPDSGTICTECGADLEFYTVLSESKVGKRLISEKSSAVRRKLRYAVPSLGETR